MEHRFDQVDVFGTRPVSGNPLAVVHDAEGLDDTTLQRVASWIGLSETTFLLPPTDPAADYRVRIFTPGRELPFAGHPTLGSAYVWRAAGGVARTPGRIVQECGVGLVTVRDDGDRLAFQAPPLIRYHRPDDALLARVAAGLGLRDEEVLDASWLVNGPEWLGVRLASAQRVLELEVDQAALAGLDIGLVGPYAEGAGPDGPDAQVEVRGLVPGAHPNEDPATGSLNAGMAQWLMDTGQVGERYVAAQGTRLGRAARLHVERVDGRIWVGGQVTPVLRGTATL